MMNFYYSFGMQMPGRKYSEVNSNYRYGFNGKELEKETSGTSAYDYGFRIYSPGLGRFLSVDPLASKFPWQSPYVAMDNNPILKTDPTGTAASPIYVDGLYMGTDNQGFKGDALLMTSTQYGKLSEATKNQITTSTLPHSTALGLGQTLGKAIDNLATSSNAKSDFEIVSKVINNIVSKTDLTGLNMKNLYSGTISTFYESPDLKRRGSYNEGERDYWAFASTNRENNKVTFQLLKWGDNEIGNKFRPTVENLQNVFVHEEGGHYLKTLGSDAPAHIKVYQFQMSHPTWNGTTPYFKSYEKDILKEYESELPKK